MKKLVATLLAALTAGVTLIPAGYAEERETSADSPSYCARPISPDPRCWLSSSGNTAPSRSTASTSSSAPASPQPNAAAPQDTTLAGFDLSLSQDDFTKKYDGFTCDEQHLSHRDNPDAKVTLVNCLKSGSAPSGAGTTADRLGGRSITSATFYKGKLLQLTTRVPAGTSFPETVKQLEAKSKAKSQIVSTELRISSHHSGLGSDGCGAYVKFAGGNAYALFAKGGSYQNLLNLADFYFIEQPAPAWTFCGRSVNSGLEAELIFYKNDAVEDEMVNELQRQQDASKKAFSL